MGRKSKSSNQIFSNRLKELLETKNVAIIDLANAIGITRQAIGKYLACDSIPNIYICQDIAEYFGVTTDYLVGKDSQPKHTEEDIFNDYGLTTETLEKLKKLKEEAIGREDISYLIYIINSLLQEINVEEESGLLFELKEYIGLNFNKPAYVINKETIDDIENNPKITNYRLIKPEDLDMINVFNLQNAIKQFKADYNTKYREYEEDAIYLYSNKPNEDGFYFIDDIDKYYKDGKYYYIDGEGYYTPYKEDKFRIHTKE